eukprot:CAMPEP_0177532960 /NCGR_PEP_ID=MMETSP0369-20130122/55007_1 /TAXON_ID=447022 ORGANISM="Scrippsiella hangoei-like, Strain SHHI-4" /NCGR_SAMPLE_ID=MMETSP0369 /ASSEMBLY_ACC=CAM_ASM_000364 /LENGTH=103 /DNA_ID=CAMNT_0019014509 /DNA_START=42 /DNA_END=350 /DNA_ORIENTATION=-
MAMPHPTTAMPRRRWARGHLLFRPGRRSAPAARIQPVPCLGDSGHQHTTSALLRWHCARRVPPAVTLKGWGPGTCNERRGGALVGYAWPEPKSTVGWRVAICA